MIALIIRDLRISVRAGGGFGLSLAFFFIIVIFFPFAIGPDLDLLSKVAPGTLWVGALLACLLSLERIFALDFEDGTLDLLATSSLPLESVVISKALVHWLTTGLPLVLLTPFFGILLGLRLNSGNETRRTFVINFGFASLHSHFNFWCGSG